MPSHFRFLYLIKIINPLIPTVPKPNYPIRIKQKILWTILVLFIFLLCSQIPLYGIYKTESSDPLHWIRVISASNSGTLMELGTTPIFSANIFINLLIMSKMIDVDVSVKEDLFLVEQFKKLFAIIISIGGALSYILGEHYGLVSEIGLLNCILLFIQLFATSIIVLILDEVLENGYGLGSGVSLFIATNISENIFWKCFSPYTITNEKGIEYEGAVVALTHFLITKSNKIEALKSAFFRTSATNISNIFSTFLMILIVIFLEEMRLMIKINNRCLPGVFYEQKIKLLYCSNTPLIMLTGILSNIYMISQVLHKKYPNSFIIKILGVWDVVNGHYVPISGISYYISPVHTFEEFIKNPIKSAIYILFVVISSGYFAKSYIELTGKGGLDLSKRLRSEGFFLENLKDGEETTYDKLRKNIEVAAFLGGGFIGFLNVLANFLGTIGSGTGTLLLINYILGFRRKLINSENESLVRTLY